MFGLMPSTDTINVYNSYIELPNYEPGSVPKLEDELSTWNKNTYSRDYKGLYYDEEKNSIRIPRGFDVDRIARLTLREINVIQYNSKERPIKKVIMGSTGTPRDDMQREGIQFLLGTGNYCNMMKHSQLVLNLPPGKGKTFMTVTAVAEYRQRAIIIVHNTEILNQWKDAFVDFTNLIPEDIELVIGSKCIDKLFDTPSNKINGKVFITSHRTLMSYANEDYTIIDKLFKHLEVGIKIYDEAHLEFVNMVKVDTNTNVKRTFYLTATFDRSDVQESYLFKKCFGNIPKYSINISQEEKHLIHVTARYNSNPSYSEVLGTKNMHGFNKNAFCDYSIQQDIFFKSINDLLGQFVHKTNGKHLILVSKKDACNAVKKHVERVFQDKDIIVINSDTPKKDKERMHDYDIIISTPKSLGTGVDIPGLRSCINTEPYSSRVLAEQVSGRLRPHKDGQPTYYVETIDTGFKRTEQMLTQRMPVFKAKCLKLINIDL